MLEPVHIFLSYSTKDVHVVRRLRDALQKQGISVYPERVLTPGSDQWRANVEQNIALSACVLVALSPNTLTSTWVKIALDYARQYQIPVIPVVIRGDAGHILMVQLEGSVWFDLRYWSNFASEVKELSALLRQYLQEKPRHVP